MLASGEDSARLRFALGSEYLKLGNPAEAIGHLSVAVSLDPDYSAAFKLLGRSQAEAGIESGAIDSYKQGIEVAARCGDEQAAREMRVFLKRLQEAD